MEISDEALLQMMHIYDYRLKLVINTFESNSGAENDRYDGMKILVNIYSLK